MSLRDRRDELGLTQAEVAAKSGIHLRDYQRYECGKQKPSVQTAIRIANTLERSVESLFNNIGNHPAS